MQTIQELKQEIKNLNEQIDYYSDVTDCEMWIVVALRLIRVEKKLQNALLHLNNNQLSIKF